MSETEERPTINLILPTPPPLNHLHYIQVVKPKFGKPWVKRGLTTVGEEYKAEVAKFCDGLVPMVGDVWVTLRWFRPRRIGDLDGIFKIILDGLTGHAYLDDKQVARIHADRFDDKFHPRVEVEIKPLQLC